MSEHHDSTLREVDVPTLVAELAQVPDPRGRQGRHYSWLYLLEVLAVGVLVGQKSVRGMAPGADAHKAELVACLKPTRRKVPSAATLCRVASKVPIAELEQYVSRYCAALDAADATQGQVVTQQGERLRGQSVDGKTVCTASAYEPLHHLVSVARHGSGVVLAQAETGVKLAERQVAQTLLTPAQLAGTVTTLDALHTQRLLTRQILAGGGHYLMIVKRNQPAVYAALELAFGVLPPATPADAADAAAWGYAHVEIERRGPGAPWARHEVRTLERLTVLNDYLDWPGVGQVLRRTRRCTHRRTGKTTHQVRYALTSLAPDQVSLAQLEQIWRGHWTIENQVHHVRDVSLGEDACRVRSGHAVEALAAFRNAILALLRFEGWPCTPTACRHFAAHPQLALHLIGAITS